jgi:Tfp pilus assembly protein PilO
MAAKKSTWVGGTALLAAALMAGTWLVAVQPTLARPRETQEQADITEAQNELLRAKNAQLAADFANLPTYQADLDALRVGLPPSIDLSDYLRQLDAAAEAAGIVITAVEPGVPQVVPGPSVAVPAATDAETEDAGTADSESMGSGLDDAESAAAPATGTTAGIAGFTAVPIKITVVGSFPAALAFLSNVQTTDGRLLLVSNLVGTGQAEAEASGGRPATQEGDIEMSAGGFLYVLTDPAQAAGGASDDGTTEPLPQGDVSGRVGSGS